MSRPRTWDLSRREMSPAGRDRTARKGLLLVSGPYLEYTHITGKDVPAQTIGVRVLTGW